MPDLADSGRNTLPDWSGQACAIIAGGFSVRRDDVALLRDKVRVIVVNNAFMLAPWADMLYAADLGWWCQYRQAEEFQGLKVSASQYAAIQFGGHAVDVCSLDSDEPHGLSTKPGIIAHGGHSGHQALNLAVQTGARKILLLGYDFCGDHWHGDHQEPLRNPTQQKMAKWAERMDALLPRLISLGVSVVNCSFKSRLTAYPKMMAVDAISTLRVNS